MTTQLDSPGLPRKDGRSDPINVPQSAQAKWRVWAERTLGGTTAQVEAATHAAIAALADGAPQQAAVDAARTAWTLVFASQAAQANHTDHPPLHVIPRGSSAVNVPRSVHDKWQAWVKRTLGGSEAQVEAATQAAITAVADHASQGTALRAAEVAWTRASPPPDGSAQRQAEREAPDRPRSEKLGIYEVLLQDNSAPSREAIALINKLQVSRHPRLTACLGRRSSEPLSKRAKLGVGLAVFAWLLIAATHISWVRAHDGPVTPVPILPAFGISLAVCAVATIPYLLLVITTRYKIQRARLFVTSGLLARHTTPHELYRVTHVEVHQSLCNRFTRDGTLVITTNDGTQTGKGVAPRVLVTGLAPIGDEEARSGLWGISADLMDLIGLLRTNKAIQGYLQ